MIYVFVSYDSIKHWIYFWLLLESIQMGRNVGYGSK